MFHPPGGVYATHPSVLVDYAAVADGDDKHNESGLLKLANDPEVAQTITPEPELAVPKRLTKAAGVVRLGNALLHVVENLALDFVLDWTRRWAVEFLEVLDGLGVVLNRPSQAGSEPGRW
jgi:hypothetical protein